MIRILNYLNRPGQGYGLVRKLRALRHGDHALKTILAWPTKIILPTTNQIYSE